MQSFLHRFEQLLQFHSSTGGEVIPSFSFLEQTMQDIVHLPQSKYRQKLYDAAQHFKEKHTIKNYRQFLVAYALVVEHMQPHHNHKLLEFTFRLSEVFPHLWEFIELYAPIKEPPKKLKKIKDLRVRVFVFPLHEFVAEPTALTAWFQGFHERISINLNHAKYSYGIDSPLPTNENEAKEFLLKSQQNHQFQAIIAHEYQHYLQHGQKATLPNHIANQRHALRGFAQDMFRISGLKFLLKPIDALFENAFVKYRETKYLWDFNQYYRARHELDARMAEFVYLRTMGFSRKQIVEHANSGRKHINPYTLPEEADAALKKAEENERKARILFEQQQTPENKKRWQDAERMVFECRNMLQDFRKIFLLAEDIVAKMRAKEAVLEQEFA